MVLLDHEDCLCASVPNLSVKKFMFNLEKLFKSFSCWNIFTSEPLETETAS